MGKYRNISRIKFGLGYLPAVIIGSSIFFAGKILADILITWVGLMALILLILATTLVWRKVLIIRR